MPWPRCAGSTLPDHRLAAPDVTMTIPLPAGSRARVARTARTIAALAEADAVAAEHVAEALAYRSPQELAA